MMSTTTGSGGPVAMGAEEPRHVGTMLELADGKWTDVGAIAHLERQVRGRTAQAEAPDDPAAPATVEETVVFLRLTRPSTVAEGQTETVTVVSPYPVEVLVQAVERLKRLRETPARAAQDE
jgi:hypothetical protein